MSKILKITLYNKIVIKVSYGKAAEDNFEIKDSIIKKGILNFDVAKNGDIMLAHYLKLIPIQQCSRVLGTDF